ncbi:MAG: ABC transporter permease [Deltaproteobacteria bacterium]|nr:ABC transporter permease [Deltaproteobacteria bacterium]MCL5277179.1 ABC transporter permease [Deltaproteobacteria bacterium]
MRRLVLPVYVITLRDLKKFFRQRSRLIGMIARPLTWLLIIGTGLNQIIKGSLGVTYIQFILPGILGMTILFSAIFSSISIVWDREFGFMKEILVTPVSRISIAFGKMVSGTLISTVQGLIIMVAAPFIGIRFTIAEVFSLIVFIMVVSMCISAIGVFIASLIKSFESFNIIMNFIVMPMFFLSGAMYPISILPRVMRYFMYLNPLTYGIDSFKHIMFAGLTSFRSDISMLNDIVLMISFTIVSIVLAAVAFNRQHNE